MKKKLNKLLLRQIKRHFGTIDDFPAELAVFLDDINTTYESFEGDKQILQNAIEISSQELRAVYFKQKQDSEKKLLEDHKQSSERHQAILQTAIDGYWLTDSQGRFLEVNDSYCRMSGYSEKELLAMSISDMEANEDASETVRHIAKIIEEGEGRFESRHRRKDGTVYNVSISVQFKKADGGHFVVFIHDITERKKAEKLLNETNAYLENLINYANAPIIVWDPQFRITRFNHAFESLTGRTEAEVKGQSLEILFPPAQAEKSMGLIRKTITGERWETVEIEILHIDLTARTVLWNSATVFETDGITPVSTIAQGQDITSRIRVEDRLRQLSQAVEQSPVTIMITDKRGAIQYVNPKFTELTGYSLDEIIGKNPRILKSGYTSSEEYNKLWTTIQSGGEWTGEFHNKKKNGDLYWESAKISPIVNAQGETTHFLAVKEDITRRKQADEEIKLKTEELVLANAEKDKFFSIIAHDLRGPFHGFMGLTQIMAENITSMTMDDLQELASIMKQSAANLFRLLGNLLEWSSMQRGITHFNPDSFLLQPKITGILALAQEAANRKLITISYDIPSDLSVYADNNMLEGILRNLVTNAVKYTPRGGSIVISANTLPDRSVEISVKDMGIGMDKNLIDTIFVLGVNTSREGTEGEPSTGLGLIICKDFVEKHGGRLWVESEEGKGSTFHFTLPAENAPKRKPDLVNPVLTVDPSFSDRKLKIVIAEDDEAAQVLLGIAVKPFSHMIIKVNTGIAAVEACLNNPDTDLVLMDIKMPEMDGYEATRQIRQFNKDVVIIAQTAYGSSDDRDKSLESGCNDHIMKPINVPDLKDIINKHLKF